MLMQNAALELGRHGIRANAIGPGLVETPLSAPLWQNDDIRDAFIAETPTGRYARPDEIADLALYLASDASSFLTGQTIYIDGGQCLKKYPETFRFMPGGGG
jgi:NAD(P)-dependent dehydrogenase (short-subunit alcohol dehydrogenase family)